MPSARFRRQGCAGILLVLVFVLALGSGRVRAEPATEARRPFPARGSSAGSRAGSPEGSGGWWLGTAGIALGLALCGGISVASKRYLPPRPGTGSLRVIGRASLSPRQAVYLLEVGERILIVGAGAQGPPALLGELTDPADRARFVSPRRTAAPASATTTSVPRFDQRIGDDE